MRPPIKEAVRTPDLEEEAVEIEGDGLGDKESEENGETVGIVEEDGEQDSEGVRSPSTFPPPVEEVKEQEEGVCIIVKPGHIYEEINSFRGVRWGVGQWLEYNLGHRKRWTLWASVVDQQLNLVKVFLTRKDWDYLEKIKGAIEIEGFMKVQMPVKMLEKEVQKKLQEKEVLKEKVELLKVVKL